MTLRQRLAREDGIGVVVAIAAMGIMLALAGVAVQKAVSALDRSHRQAEVKRSLQSADAGVDAAIYQVNRLDLGSALDIDAQNPLQINTSQMCVTNTGVEGEFGAGQLTGATADPQGRVWCPVVREHLGEGGRSEYRVSTLARVNVNGCGGAGVLGLDREIVAVGYNGRSVRRIHARLRAALSLTSGAAVQAASTTSPLTMSASARVVGDVHANHDITGSGGVPTITGNAIPGPGETAHRVSGVAVTGSTLPACQRLTLPNVAQADAPAVNDNGSWTADCVSLLAVPTSCTSLLGGQTGGVEWVPSQRTLRVWGTARLRLTGDTYSFCRLRLEGQAMLQVPPTAGVARIFLDDPANCGSVSGAGQVTVDGQARLVNCHAASAPETLQLYAVGNAGSLTTQTLAGAAPLTGAVLSTACGAGLSLTATPMVVYAPRSAVVLQGSTGIQGQVAADTVFMGGSARVDASTSLANLNALGSRPILPLYQPTEYVECTPVGFQQLPPSEPAKGC